MAEGDGTEGTEGEGTGTEGTGADGGTGGKTAGTGEGKGGKSEPDWKNEAEKWKALSRKNEAAAKRLQAIEDANKTELQKAQEEAARLKEENQGLTKKAMRAEIGAEKKLPAVIAARLQGDTIEEMRADADAILKELGKDGSGGSGGDGGGDRKNGGRNRENLTSLLEASGGGKLPDMNDWMRSQRGAGS